MISKSLLKKFLYFSSGIRKPMYSLSAFSSSCSYTSSAETNEELALVRIGFSKLKFSIVDKNY